MSKICEVCGLPEELCVCEEIAREVQTVKVYTVRRRFGKLMTIVEGIDEHDIDIKDLTKTLKARCACGGTAKKGQRFYPTWDSLPILLKFVIPTRNTIKNEDEIKLDLRFIIINISLSSMNNIIKISSGCFLSNSNFAALFFKVAIIS